MFQDIIKELASRCIGQYDADVPVRLDDLVQAHYVGVVEFLQDINLAVDLGQALRVVPQCLAADELDGYLCAVLAFPA